MDSHDNILEMRNIRKSFAGVPALQDVSFRCRRGSVHALLGENGAGKSTLIKILSGAYQADSGEILYNGMRFTHLSARQALRIGIRVIYQELALLPDMTVAENVFLGHEPRNTLGLVDWRRMITESKILLDRAMGDSGMAIDPTMPAGELTVAHQQIVEIAKALSEKANLLVMDEPSAILAGHELENLFATIRNLTAQGVTIIYISHRLNEIFEIADEVTVLKDGKLSGTAYVADMTRTELIRMMVGRPLEEVFPPSRNLPGQPALVVENLSLRGPRGMRDVSFVLRAGEITGLAGMVGSGRTELARALFGVDQRHGGTIRVNGTLLPNRHTPKHAVQAGLALVPEDRKTQGLLLPLSVRKNITLPILHRLSKLGLIRRNQETTVVGHARTTLAIQMHSPDQQVRYLSGGNQQKVVLAKWLQTEPTVLILDEPTRGIDVGAKFEIYQLMRELTQRGVAILMISSELPEILGMSDRILVMQNGRLVGELARSEATEESIVELAITGRTHSEARPV